MKKFLENFWYYHKWKLLVALMVVMVIVNTISEFSAADSFDHSVGIVTMADVSEADSQALSQGFARILPDTDGDGAVTVQVNVYHYGLGQDITPNTLTEDDAVHLAADVRVGMSILFLAEDPAVFADSGLTELGQSAGYSALAFLPEAFSDMAVFVPATAAELVMEALG